MNPERINIKDLTIEEPEKEAEVFFDPETEITASDWKHIEDVIEWARQPQIDKRALFHQMAAMKILNSNIDSRIDINQQQWKSVGKELKRWWSEGGASYWSDDIIDIKLCNPKADIHHIPGDDQIHGEDRFWACMEDLQHEQEEENWVNYLQLAANMKIIWPEADLKMEGIDWQKVVDAIMKVDGISMRVYMAKDLKIIKPELGEVFRANDWK